MRLLNLQQLVHGSSAEVVLLTQEKKVPRKAQGTKQPATASTQVQAQETDLIEDALLPPSKKAMPV